MACVVSAAWAVQAGETSQSAGAQPKSRAALLADLDLPEPVDLPQPQDAVELPEVGSNKSVPIRIRLGQDPPPGPLTARRVAIGDGRLYLGVRLAAGGDLAGKAEVTRGDHKFETTIAGGELWLSLVPRIGTVTIEVSSPGATRPVELIAPTTLVEVRGRQIFLNGEVFLLKGATSRNINEHDAAYARSLGINTLRGQDALADCERFGFMSIASLGFGDAAPKSAFRESDTAEFETTIARSMEWLRENAPAVVASPNTLIVQLGNEKSPGGPPPGSALTPPRRNVAQFLVHAYNTFKPMAPGLPVGFANHDLGFPAPDCMDLYMHNSYLDEDRYNFPWKDYLRWQGCLPPDGPTGDGRPFVNTEFGANRYLAQHYHAGPTNPVLEKIHAWNFPNRWAEFMDHNTVGGAIYCLYDLETPHDQGNSRFGILTLDGQPKLACWDIGRMWRDFDVEVRGGDLLINYKRDYHARDCLLTVTTPDNQSTTHPLQDFAPRSSRTIALGDLGLGGARELRWQLDFTTHGGLANQAVGAWPIEAEQRDFLARLKDRDTYPFLRELFDTQVLTAAGQRAPRTLAEMARPEDGIIPVALRKPSGVTYLLLISREKIGKDGPLRDGVTIDVAFKGKVERVDDTTGQPLPGTVDAIETPTGLRLRNVQAARIPGAIGDRSDVPFKLPIYRITP